MNDYRLLNNMQHKSDYFYFLQKNKNNKQLLPIKIYSSTEAGFKKLSQMFFYMQAPVCNNKCHQ